MAAIAGLRGVPGLLPDGGSALRRWTGRTPIRRRPVVDVLRQLDSAIAEARPTLRPESTGTGRATGIEVLLQRSTGRVTGWATPSARRSASCMAAPYPSNSIGDIP